jgi:exosortase
VTTASTNTPAPPPAPIAGAMTAGGAPTAGRVNGARVLAVVPAGDSVRSGLADRGTLVRVGLLGAAFVLLFRHWFITQHGFSSSSGDWSHAYGVPLISLWLLWQHREKLERVETMVFWPGLVAILMGIWSYVYFIVGVSTHLGQGLAMVLTLFGVVLLLLGPRFMKYAFLPISYLVFAITIPEKVMNYATWPLQALAAKGAWVGLNTLGIKTDVLGNQLMVFDTTTLKTFPLNVAQACSGMRMLIAFLALGGAVSLVATRLWWKRVVLIGLAPPIALLLNIVRIMVLGFMSLYNPNFASGQAHTFIGTLLLIPGFFLYLGIVYSLNKAVPETAGAAAAVKKTGHSAAGATA